MQIREICEKYGIDGVAERYEQDCKDLIQVGFLGEFSSGKSSLINSLLKRDLLQTALKPTTKAITHILFDKKTSAGFVPSENYYIKQNDEFEEISKSKFESYQLGDGERELFVRLEIDSDILNDEFEFIDTPGISSLDDMDLDITFGYLPNLDCAVICQDINQGSLTKSILDFVSLNANEIADNLIFALTKSDLKSPGECNAVKQAVINQLKELEYKGKFKIPNLEQRVVLTSNKGENTEFFALIKDEFYKNFTTIQDKKIAKLTQEYKKRLVEILKDRTENIDTSDDELIQKSENIKNEIAIIEDTKNKELARLEDFVYSKYPVIDAVSAQSVEFLQNRDLDSFRNLIIDTIGQILKEYFKGININLNFVSTVIVKEVEALLNQGKIASLVVNGLFKIAPHLANVADNTIGNTYPVAKPFTTVIKHASKALPYLGDKFASMLTTSPDEIQDFIASSLKEILKQTAKNLADENIFSKFQTELDEKYDSANDIINQRKENANAMEAIKNEILDDIEKLINEIRK